MAVSRGQRLRKKAAKAVKRKAVVAQKLAVQRRDLSISKPRHIDLAASPIVDCSLVVEEIETGDRSLAITRKLPLGRFGTATFSLNFMCFGVEEAFFVVEEAEDYERFLAEVAVTKEALEPARARRLLRDAAAFGAANGFPPPPEFAEMERILADVEPAGEPFAFGDNGRPHYVVSPHEHPRGVEERIAILTEALGPNGFDLTYPVEEDEPEAT